jgi:hypothetical protein
LDFAFELVLAAGDNIKIVIRELTISRSNSWIQASSCLPSPSAKELGGPSLSLDYTAASACLTQA